MLGRSSEKVDVDHVAIWVLAQRISLSYVIISMDNFILHSFVQVCFIYLHHSEPRQAELEVEVEMKLWVAYHVSW